MTKKRIQLTLFADENESKVIENIREEFNPEQYKLIKAHVTLCREDEIAEFSYVLKSLENLNHNFVTIDFGEPERFSNGKGVLLPATGNNEAFHELRKLILQGMTKNFRTHQPHVTLMHPRNSACTDGVFNNIKKANLPKVLTFKKISLIEKEFDNKWNVISEYQLQLYFARDKKVN